MSEALHVRYRPATLKEVVGHKSVVQSLKKVVKDRRAKTFLFTGAPGLGKTTMARILANEFAGRRATQANIIEVNAASVNGVDDMRDLTHRSQFKAVGDTPIKAIILDEAHRLTSAAWTVLLKPTEEPPSHVYWMFCTTELGKIPKNIQTRCVRYSLDPLNEDELLEVLTRVVKQEKLELSKDILELIAENSDGSPRQALTYLEKCLYAESIKDARKIIRAAEGQQKEVVDLCRLMLKGGSWAQALKIINDLKHLEAESIRIAINAYLQAVLLNTKSEKQAVNILFKLECFSDSYNPTDKHAPLLLSIAEALGMTEE